jgi:predicted alpha/beta hydrolase family esterase
LLIDSTKRFFITSDLNGIIYSQLVGFLPTGPSDLATVEEKQKYLERMNRSPAASRYFSIIEKASPNDMIEKFASTASIGAQAGLDSQLQNIIGTLPK